MSSRWIVRSIPGQPSPSLMPLDQLARKIRVALTQAEQSAGFASGALARYPGLACALVWVGGRARLAEAIRTFSAHRTAS
jgi:thiamine pyrophosphate-dependent acetolactate synthase large subunit-like protein